MRYRKFLVLNLLWLCPLLLLSACSSISVNINPASTATTGASPQSSPSDPTTTSTSTSANSLKNVDWNNFTYTFGCFTAQPVQVKMKNGEAEQNGVRYTVQKPVFGDLNGDGQPEAVILYHCEGGGTSPQLVYVFSGTAQQPRLLAALPGQDDKLATVMHALVGADLLQLSGYGYSNNTPLCCPDLLITSTYRWNGSKFTRLMSNSVPRPPDA